MSQSSLFTSNSGLFGNLSSNNDHSELIKQTLQNPEYLNVKNESVKKERLKEIINALQKIDQTNSPPWDKSFLKYLVDRKLLFSIDPEISIHSSLAIAEVLRIVAPDHPFTNSQIHLIFSAFIHQFSLFNDVEGELFTSLFYLLEKITSIQLFSIISEVTPQLIDKYIDTIYKVVENKDEFYIHVEKYFADNLILLFEEIEIEPETLNKILEPLVHYSKNEPKCKASYKLSSIVLNSSIEHILSPLSSLINSELAELNKSKGKVVKKEKSKRGKLFHTILQLNNINTKLLLYIMPNLCEEIVDEDITIRLPAVNLMGKMFTSKESQLHLDYPHLFEGEFLSRFSDVDTNIRLLLSKISGEILLNHHSTKKEINYKLTERLRDPDDKVRTQIVDTVCNVAEIDDSLIEIDLMKEVSGRCRDKRTPLRLHAMNRVAKLYRHVKQKELTTEKPWTNEQELKFGWIPANILQYSISMEDPGHRMYTEILFYDDLLPNDSSLRTQTLFDIYSSMDSNDRKLFDHFVTRKLSFRNGVKKLLEGKNEKINNQFIAILTDYLPDKNIGKTFWKNYKKYSSDIHDFIYEVFHTISNFNDVSLLKNKLNELKSLNEDEKTYVDFILKRCSMNLLTQEQIIVLLEWVISLFNEKEEDRDMKRIYDCLSLIYLFVKKFPELINEQSRGCLATILEKDESKSNILSLKILQYSKITSNKLDKSDLKLKSLLLTFLNNDSAVEAKYASKCISSLFQSDSFDIFEDQFTNLTKELDCKNQKLPCVLSTISFIAKKYPKIYSEKSLYIIDFVIDEIIMKNFGEAKSGHYDNPSLEVEIKKSGIDLLVSHLDYLSSNSHDNVEADTDSSKIINILFDIIEVKGEVSLLDSNRTGYTVRLDKISQAHFRLAAAIALIRIACKSRYISQISKINRLCQLAILSRDENRRVREDFEASLTKYLSKLKLSNSFYSLLLLFVGDEDKDIACNARRDISISFKYLKKSLLSTSINGELNMEAKEAPILFPEYTLPTLILLLSRWPDFDNLYPQFNPFQKIIFAYFDEVTQDSDNYSFFLQLLRKIKQRRDFENLESNNPLIICDICTAVLNNCAETRSFSTMPFPGKIFIPQFFSTVHHSIQDKEMDYCTLLLPYDFKLSVKGARSFSPSKSSKKLQGDSLYSDDEMEIDTEKSKPTTTKRSRTEQKTPEPRKRRKTSNEKENIPTEKEVESPPKSSAKKRKRIAL